MGFFAALSRILGDDRPTPARATDDRDRLLQEWGLSDTAHPEFPSGKVPAADPAEMAAPPEPSGFDRGLWFKKLKHLLEKLPDSESQWDDFLADAGALGIPEEESRRAMREEFVLLIRRAVADSVLEPQERRKIELARSLIGLSDAEALSLLNEVATEAESFFGRKIEGYDPSA